MAGRVWLVLLAAVVGLGACEEKGAPGEAAGGGGEAALRIAVVPKGTTHDFWKSVHAGALQAEAELHGVSITFRGPEREDDREQQVALVQNLVTSDYDAIVLAPLDDRALVAPVRLAERAGIPVVIMDSDLAGEAGTDFVCFVGTNNHEAGRLAGERMAALLPEGGRVLLLRYQEGSASTRQREEGFVEALGEHDGIELVDPGRYAGATRATAQEAAENLLAADESFAGVFCPNESSTFGMLLALRARGLAGEMRFVGFDSSEGLVEALGTGEIDALVVQNPKRMGFLGVKSAVDHIRGAPVEAVQDTGALVVTADDLDDPEVRALLGLPARDGG